MTIEYNKFDNDFCAEESPSGAPMFFRRSGWRKWLFPALMAAVILILIIAIGATNTKTSNHLGSVEQRVSNLTVAVQSLTSSLQQQHVKDTKTSNRLGSVEQSVSNLRVALQSLTTSLQQHVKDTKTSNRLGSVEQSVSNLSVALQSLTTSLQQHVKDTKTSNRLGSVEQSVSNLSVALQSLTTSLQQHVKDAAEEVMHLQSDMSNTVYQLSSVSEMLKQLSVLDSLSRTVASLNCEMNRIINNGTLEAGCCSLNWMFFSSSCYFFSKTALSWDESRDWCSSQDGHLVMMHTDEEWDFVTRNSKPTSYWVGLTDERTGEWEWVDQTPYVMDRRRWQPNQPDSWTKHGLGPGDEDCAHLYYTGRLNDLHCSTKLRFICQRRS